MGLYPATINDGAAERTVTLRGQLPSKTSIKTEYFEPGGDLTLISEYKILGNNQTVHNDVSRVKMEAAVDTETSKPITVNISLMHDKRHSEADIAKALAVAFGSLPDAAARLNFARRLP